MMNVYYGPESVDREKFIFERINPDEKSIIIVPDQFSLQMEKDVLAYFRAKEGRAALLNLMVADFSSLGNKVVKAAGGKEPELIDKYGRHMLLSVIISSLAEQDKLGIYRKMKGRNSFTAGMNQLISEMKRYKVGVDDILGAEKTTDSFLKSKLADIGLIFSEYEDAISGRFTDTEDYMSFYGEIMATSELIKDADIWVYGFDTFTPLHMDVLSSILGACRQMNVVMTCGEKGSEGDDLPDGLYDLSWAVIRKLKDMAEEADSEVTVEAIVSSGTGEDATGPDAAFAPPVTVLAATSGIYAEADRVAAHIWELVRDKGYRFSDITVICNDMDVRGNILRRTFDRWGIPAFADKKRKVLHQPVVRFLLSFMKIISAGYEGGAIMEMASSGLMGWTREDEELLANYVQEAVIRGGRWKQPFTWTGRDDRGSRYSEDDLERLNGMRRELIDMVESGKEEIGRRNSAVEKINGFYGYLEDKFCIRTKIGQLIQKQQELGLTEGAAETAQSWNMICGLFTQIVRIIGEEQISNENLMSIMASGLSEMEIGLVPSGSDLVIIGTLQRTRVSSTKCMIITAANEGILPLQTSESGLLTSREIDLLEGMRLNVTKKETVRRQEEQLAIHRMISLPEEELFVTCSLADEDGKSATPSSLFMVLRERTGARVQGDLAGGEVIDMISSRKGSLSFLADAMRNYLENGNIDESWLLAMNWYREKNGRDFDLVERGLTFENRRERLETDLADALYFGNRDAINVSASRLEQYTGCPFRHFIERGLKADEPRTFEIDSRSRGDIYHEALQKLSKMLMPPEGVSVTAPESPWMKITREECREKVAEIIAEETAGYREGLYEKEAFSRLQRSRIIDTCSDVAWAMIGQVRKSRTEKMFFEEPFGAGSPDGQSHPDGAGSAGSRWLKPVVIQLERGRKAVLQGRIDRIDIIRAEVGEGDGICEGAEVARIIDYKTGNAEINREYMEKGYKLQLMVYMNAVNMDPAGVFYFRISDLDINADEKGTPGEKGETVEDRIARNCRLEGLLVDNENILYAMDGELGPSVSSTAIPVKQLKNGTIKKEGSGELLTTEEFAELCEKTSEHVERICREIQDGRIEIRPKMEKNKQSRTGGPRTACAYCRYSSICMFDTSFRNCSYEMI